MWNSPRAMNVLAMMVGGAALVALLTVCVVHGARSARFSIQKIVFTAPLVKADRVFIERIIRKEFGGTYFTLNLPNAQKALARVPWVKSVSIRRVWPRALEIKVNEYEAFARWNAEALVSAEGDVFSGVSTAELPQLNGPEGSERDVVEKYKRASVALKPLGYQVRTMTLSPSYSLSAELDQGASVHFGREHFDERLQRLIDHSGSIREKISLPIDSFDLRYSRGIAIAMNQDAVSKASEATVLAEKAAKELARKSKP